MSSTVVPEWTAILYQLATPVVIHWPVWIRTGRSSRGLDQTASKNLSFSQSRLKLNGSLIWTIQFFQNRLKPHSGGTFCIRIRCVSVSKHTISVWLSMTMCITLHGLCKTLCAKLKHSYLNSQWLSQTQRMWNLSSPFWFDLWWSGGQQRRHTQESFSDLLNTDTQHTRRQ